MKPCSIAKKAGEKGEAPVMDFETFHAEQERIRQEKQAADKGAASSSFQEYLDAMEEKHRRSDNYIAYLLATRETASRNGRDRHERRT